MNMQAYMHAQSLGDMIIIMFGAIALAALYFGSRWLFGRSFQQRRRGAEAPISVVKRNIKNWTLRPWGRTQ